MSGGDAPNGILDRLSRTGVPGPEAVKSVLPAEERLARGPVAVVECFQEIPCDPCAAACPKGAILPFREINDLPAIDHSKCDGCATCVVSCPGLAIFVIDMSGGGERRGRATVKMPYEFSPLPRAGQEVWGLDRSGGRVTRARVVRVQRPAGFDRTALLTVELPAEHALDVRAVALAPEPKPEGGEAR
jgi:Fe-S-cluster-containing hydrogenase component 2